MTARSRGRPVFDVTPQRQRQVESLAGLGLTREQIGSVMGCSVDTLKRRFEAELVGGDAKAAARVAQCLFVAATSWMQTHPDGTTTGEASRAAITAAIWWEKSRCGRSERVQVEAQTTTKGELRVTAGAADRVAVTLVGEIEQLLGAGGVDPSIIAGLAGAESSK